MAARRSGNPVRLSTQSKRTLLGIGGIKHTLAGAPRAAVLGPTDASPPVTGAIETIPGGSARRGPSESGVNTGSFGLVDERDAIPERTAPPPLPDPSVQPTAPFSAIVGRGSGDLDELATVEELLRDVPTIDDADVDDEEPSDVFTSAPLNPEFLEPRSGAPTAPRKPPSKPAPLARRKPPSAPTPLACPDAPASARAPSPGRHVALSHNSVVRRDDHSALRGVRVDELDRRPAAAPADREPTGLAPKKELVRPVRRIAPKSAEPSKVRTTTTEAKQSPVVREEPSIIVDMGHVGGEHDARPDGVQLLSVAADTGSLSEPGERSNPAVSSEASSDFAPFAAHKPTPPAIVADVDHAAELKPGDDEDIDIVRPPGLWRLVLATALLAIVTFATFVAWRNDWGPIWQDPATAVDIAIGNRERPTPVAPKQQVHIEEIVTTRGKFQFRDVALERLGSGAKALSVSGVLVNGTNQTQAAITIEVTLLHDALPVQQRVIACCSSIGSDAAIAIANDPKHVHFQERFTDLSERQMVQGDSQPFTVVFRDVDRKYLNAELTPVARVKYAEVVQ